MNHYRICWEIDEYADTPHEAVKKVWDNYFAKAGHEADHFTVTGCAYEGEPTLVDFPINANEDCCRKCGKDCTGGDGFDGLCPSCADKAEEAGEFTDSGPSGIDPKGTDAPDINQGGV